MFEKITDVGVLRERFILHRLGQVSRFGRYDIETFLEQEAEAAVPDCKHQTLEPDCLWCWISQSDLFSLPSTLPVSDLFENVFTPVSIKTCEMRLFSVEPYRSVLGQMEKAKYFVGRDRFVVMIVDHKQYLFEIRNISDTSDKTQLLCRLYGAQEGFSSLALADLLLAEWMRQTDRSALARSILVSSLQIQVCEECGRAGEDFDASVAVSADGSKIIKASWVVVYDPKKKIMMFHRPDWFAENKFQISSNKRRAFPDKHLALPNAKDINSFSPIATFVRDQLLEHVSEGDQVIIPVGRKAEPILFLSSRQLQKDAPTGVCQVQLP
jgi:hypothetical protein